MKLWVDDLRRPPKGYVWCKSVNDAIMFIEQNCNKIELIDIDHDAGFYAYDGGDYIQLLNWLEVVGLSFPIRIHTMNVVGRQNMQLIIRKNGWREVR